MLRMRHNERIGAQLKTTQLSIHIFDLFYCDPRSVTAPHPTPVRATQMITDTKYVSGQFTACSDVVNDLWAAALYE